LFQLIEEEFDVKVFLVIAILLVAGFAGLGFYRGWFQLSSESDNAEHTINTTFTVDENKIQNDKEKVQEFAHQTKEETVDTIDPGK
jgi:hypothetical protein